MNDDDVSELQPAWDDNIYEILRDFLFWAFAKKGLSNKTDPWIFFTALLLMCTLTFKYTTMLLLDWFFPLAPPAERPAQPAQPVEDEQPQATTTDEQQRLPATTDDEDDDGEEEEEDPQPGIRTETVCHTIPLLQENSAPAHLTICICVIEKVMEVDMDMFCIRVATMGCFFWPPLGEGSNENLTPDGVQFEIHHRSRAWIRE